MIQMMRKSGFFGCRRAIAAVLVTVLSGPAATAVAQETDGANCGSLVNAFGPFDYTNPLHTTEQAGRGEHPLSLVERAHFTREVENLVRGESSYDPLEDLEYTLRAFPNHHRALYSMANYHLRKGLSKRGQYTIDCWFDRAVRFAPSDAVVRIVYGVFLAKKGDEQGALDQYRQGLDMNPRLAEGHYNIGLLYANLDQMDMAVDHAKRAYELGYPLPGLRNRLRRVGAWPTANNN